MINGFKGFEHASPRLTFLQKELTSLVSALINLFLTIQRSSLKFSTYRKLLIQALSALGGE